MRFLILKTVEKSIITSKIIDILVATDTISIYRKTDIPNADYDAIPIISISAIFRFIDPALASSRDLSSTGSQLASFSGLLLLLFKQQGNWYQYKTAKRAKLQRWSRD